MQVKRMAVPLPVETSAGLEPAFELSAYWPVFIYLAGVIAFAAGAVLASQWLFLKPRKDTPTKLMPYESGVDPIGSVRMQFDVKFYLIAILFLVFDVELLFLYPWATIAYADGAAPEWRNVFGRIVFWEVVVFLFTLVIAYVYAWRKGVFQWR
jgi:NADH-quinone oxidoreductase subunit A